MRPGRVRPYLALDRLSLRTCPNRAIESAGAAWSRICEDCLAVEAEICPARSRPVAGPVVGADSPQRRSEGLRESPTKIVGYAEILYDGPPAGDSERRRMSLIVHRSAGELADMMADESWTL